MKKKIISKLIVLFLIVCLFNIVIDNKALATDNYYTEAGGAESNNASDNNYSYYWSSVVNSYLQENEDGTISRIENINNTLYIDTYDSNFVLQSSKIIEGELSIFGAFYSGEDYNYIVYGQDNEEEDDSVEVVRVVKYTKDWVRQENVASIYGANTYLIFDAGSCRVTESDGTLYIDTSHEMYASSDGYHHQSNMYITIDEDTMEVTYCRYGVSNISTGYVSHSFNQYILADEEYVYTIEHGDAYPRSVVICKTALGATKITSYKSAFSIAGTIGENATGVTVGGAELSENNILVVGNSIVQDGRKVTTSETKNIFLTVSSQEDLSTTTVWLTDYEDDSGMQTCTPQLIKINDNKFLVMWEEIESGYYSHGIIRMVLVDENGELLSDIIKVGGRLSDCQPIVYNGNITWYVTTDSHSTPIFFSLDVSSVENFEQYDQKYLIKEEDFEHFKLSWSGTVLFVASFDDEVEEITVPMNYPWIKAYLSSTFKNTSNVKKVTISEGYNEILQNTFYNSSVETVIINSEIDYIGTNAFYNCTNLQDINLPDGLTKIESSAFYGCSSLESLELPETVTSIGDCAFYSCSSLYSVNIPSGVTTISKSLFEGCSSLEEFEIPSNITSIGAYAFEDTGLTGTVVIPESVLTVGKEAFWSAEKIEKIVVKNPNTEISENIIYIRKTLEIGDVLAFFEGVDIASVSVSITPSAVSVTSDGIVTCVNTGTARVQYYDSNGTSIGKIDITVVEPTTVFTDVSKTSWYYEYVEYCYENEIMTGYEGTTLFGPNDNVKRGALALIIYRMAGSPKVSSTSKFTDVQDENKYYYDAIIWASENGIVTGYGETGLFKPEATITRQELATMLYRYAKYEGKTIIENGDYTIFSDASNVSNYAISPLNWAIGEGIISGYTNTNTLVPTGNATRAQVATMIMRYCNNL